MQDSVLLERAGALATITLNRPGRLNALDLAMWQRLGEIATELAAMPELRCVGVCGAGDAFAAGADLAEFPLRRATAADAEIYGRTMVAALHGLRDLPVPTVARIRGACVGAGLEIAIMCDVRIAAASSRFGVPIQRIGVVMPYPELGDLVELVGRSAALAMLLEGRIFDADEAERIGLVTRTVADGDLEREAAATVRRIAEGAPTSHRLHKRMARRLLDPRPLAPEELAEPYRAVETADYRGGIEAFLAKRKPEFSGR
jgi:enoyl-CoA hydratase/carnithine racemase